MRVLIGGMWTSFKNEDKGDSYNSTNVIVGAN